MNVIDIVIKAKDLASGVIDGVSASTDKLKNHFSSAVDASKKAALGLTAVGVAAAGFIGYGAKIAGDLEASRQGFITLLGSAEKADATIAQIKKDASSTPFELKGLIQANQMLTSVTKDGMQSEKILMNVGKALSAMGKGQPELDRIIVNLQQIGAVGHASMLDIKQFAFAGIPIFDMLSEATGKTGDALGEMISSGGVTFEMLTEMFNKAGGAGGRFEKAFINQAGTFNQLMSNMKDVIQMTAAEIITSTGIFDLLKNAISRVVTFLTDNKDSIVEGIKKFMDLVKNNAPVIAGILVGILTPAMLSFAASIATTTLTLMPWAIAGALLAVVASKVAERMGGWSEVLKKIEPALNLAKDATSGLYNMVKLLISGDFQGGIFGLSEDHPFINALFVARDIAKKLGEVFSKAFGGLWNTISKDLLPALSRLWPMLRVIGIVIGGLIVASVAILIGAFWLFIKALTFAIKIVSALVNIFADLFKGIWFGVQAIWNVVTSVFNGMWQLFQGVVNIIIGILTVFVGIWTAIFSTIWTVISFVFGIIINIIGAYIGIIAFIVGTLVQVFMAVFNFISGIVLGVLSFIYNGIFLPIFNAIAGVVMWLWNSIISPVWEAIKAGIGIVGAVVSGVWGAIVNTAQSVFNGIRSVFQRAVDIVKSIWNGVSGFFSGIWDGLKTGAGKIVDIISGPFKTAFNKIADFWNGTAGKLSFRAPDWVPGLGGKGFDMPKIPKMHVGAENFGGGLAYVHKGEVLANLPKGTDVIPAHRAESMLGGKGDIQIGTINLNSDSAVREFFRELDKRGELSSLGVPV